MLDKERSGCLIKKEWLFDIYLTGSIILETDPTVVVQRIAIRVEEGSFTEQSVVQVCPPVTHSPGHSSHTTPVHFYRSCSLPKKI